MADNANGMAAEADGDGAVPVVDGQFLCGLLYDGALPRQGGSGML